MAVISTIVIFSVTIGGGCAMTNTDKTSHYYASHYPNSTHKKVSDLGVIELMVQVRSGANSSQSGTSSKVMITDNNVAKNMRASASDHYEIQVRMNDGSTETIVQEQIEGLVLRSRVRIVDGKVYLY